MFFILKGFLRLNCVFILKGGCYFDAWRWMSRVGLGLRVQGEYVLKVDFSRDWAFTRGLVGTLLWISEWFGSVWFKTVGLTLHRVSR